MPNSCHIMHLYVMEKTYDPDITEATEHYMENGSVKFRTILPPPNVTGKLHIGHALTVAIQDTIIKHHRQQGEETEWVPGTDHAGIATQMVVKKKIEAEGNSDRLSVNDNDGYLYNSIKDWASNHRGHIIDQLDKLNCSIDKSKSQYTMSAKMNKCVNKAFCELYRKGLITREYRMMNYCPYLNTSLSNIEVEKRTFTKPTNVLLPGLDKAVSIGWIYELEYLVVDSNGKPNGDRLTVATTRPETVFGDVALAVHPDDKRYTKYHNMKVKMLFGNNSIPIILDKDLVDMEKGTGIVKVTPAHDEKDRECGKRHKLNMNLRAFDEKGKILVSESHNNENDNETIQFNDLHRITARFKILGELAKKGQFKGKKPHEMTLSFCQRSGDLIELVPSLQWFLDCKDMAKKAMEAVEKGELKITPEYHKVTWDKWLSEIRPWCISRQIIWGHKLPVYYLTETINISSASDTHMNYIVESSQRWTPFVGETKDVAENEVTKLLGTDEWKKTYHLTDVSNTDNPNDVLDTWFSSGLYPFAIYGWGEGVEELPTLDLLETGKDILFFWVARMVMLSIELTGKLPFKQVFLHNMVRDQNGEKMSKSKGNVIDPIDVINGISHAKLVEKLDTYNLSEKEKKMAIKGIKTNYPKGIPKCGTDALRMGLLNYVGNNSKCDINLDLQEIKRHRLFCNKMWNTVKFAIKYVNCDTPDGYYTSLKMPSHHLWIIAKTHEFIKNIEKYIENFQFNECVKAIHSHWYDNICGTYLELIKYDLRDEMDVWDKNKKVLEKKFPLSSNYPVHKTNAKHVLKHVLVHTLRTVYPFMPYVSKYLHYKLTHREIESPNKFLERFMVSEVKERMNLTLKKINIMYNHKKSENGKYSKDEKKILNQVCDLNSHVEFMFYKPEKIIMHDM